MQVNKRRKSQAERLSDSLQKIRTDVTAEDRKAAFEADLGSKATISKYLNGQVMNIDTGVKLISFFRNRIIKREKVI
jgi:hypothetical protein